VFRKVGDKTVSVPEGTTDAEFQAFMALEVARVRRIADFIAEYVTPDPLEPVKHEMAEIKREVSREIDITGPLKALADDVKASIGAISIPEQKVTDLRPVLEAIANIPQPEKPEARSKPSKWKFHKDREGELTAEVTEWVSA